MKARIASALCLAFALAGCAAGKPQTSAEMDVALDVAATAEGIYAAQSGADPQTVADVARLLATARAALTAWEASSKPGDQAIASAAIAALVQYEASAGVAP